MLWKARIVICLTCALGLMLPAVAGAQEKPETLPNFDESAYKTLAPGDTKDTIAPGTRITLQNWRQYQQFMPLGLRLMLEGKSVFKYPADFEMVVGPTTHLPLPKQFRDDTEKYSRQVSLIKLPDGGYTIKGYQAGTPFPDPSGPTAGIELMYDNYYTYQPYLGAIDIPRSLSIDRYMSQTNNVVACVHFKMTHLSEKGMPVNLPNNDGMYLTENCEILAPEQSRYVTALQLFYDDPARVQETYAFIPALRRSLRLSSSARCAPFAGGDFTNDDFRNGMNLQPPIFQAKFLGMKKVLTMIFDDFSFFEMKNVYPPTMFPRPAAGKWQLRDMYLYEARRVPSQNLGYCYGSRVLYLDKEQMDPMWLDLYDHNLKYWKFYQNLYKATRIPETGEMAFASGTTAGWFTMVDLQNGHESAAWIRAYFGGDVPAKYRDYRRWGTPGGLSQIME
jgi:Protein of unknown function (DUF1329)